MSKDKSRCILITGCSSGIGHYCAMQLHGEGWTVLATARSDEDLARLESSGVSPIRLDYRDQKSIEIAFEEAMALSAGAIDAVFHNGAYAQPGAVEDIPTDALREQFEANFFGWHSLNRLVIPAMRAQGGGRIIACSSILGKFPYRWRGAYVASKYAVEGLFGSLRLEMRDTGISVSIIRPGPIASRFSDNALVHLNKNIDMDGSVHREKYKAYLARLSPNSISRFRLGPEAVYVKLRHALNAPRPRSFYGVTLPTQFMGGVARILPESWLDRLLTIQD